MVQLLLMGSLYMILDKIWKSTNEVRVPHSTHTESVIMFPV